MVAVIGFLEDRFGAGAIKMLAFSDFVFKPGDTVQCKSGFRVYEFMVPHRVTSGSISATQARLD